MLYAIDWTYVLVALIGGLPSIIAAVAAVAVHRAVSTPSGERIGKQVEEAHHMTNANAAMLTTIANGGTTPAASPPPPPPLPPPPEAEAA